jgi:hypothetical protein
MLTYGRDTDRRSNRQSAPTRIASGGMIIVESCCPKAVTSTNSNCARKVRVRSVLPMMMCFIPSFMLLGIVPAIVSAVFNAFA